MTLILTDGMIYAFRDGRQMQIYLITVCFGTRKRAGKYEAARNAFETALENKAEKTATIYNFLGNCEMQMGNAKAALNYYNLGTACEDCSEEMLQEMRFNEIAAYEQCGEWENAKAKLADYVTDYPEDARAAKEAEFFETQ